MFATNSDGRGKKWLSKDDAIRLVEAALKQQLATANVNVLVKKEKAVALAYSLSKMTIRDEMAQFELYNKMSLVEFYEFLGRLAFLVFRHEKMSPLAKKLEKLLKILIPLTGKHGFEPFQEDQTIESDSDYDDDVVDDIVQKIMSNQ